MGRMTATTDVYLLFSIRTPGIKTAVSVVVSQVSSEFKLEFHSKHRVYCTLWISVEYNNLIRNDNKKPNLH